VLTNPGLSVLDQNSGPRVACLQFPFFLPAKFPNSYWRRLAWIPRKFSGPLRRPVGIAGLKFPRVAAEILRSSDQSRRRVRRQQLAGSPSLAISHSGHLAPTVKTFCHGQERFFGTQALPVVADRLIPNS
jgi:hypothetical protein